MLAIFGEIDCFGYEDYFNEHKLGKIFTGALGEGSRFMSVRKPMPTIIACIVQE
ncbi:MAG: hypothetical protein HUJ51_04035 [Eggerthellaceae bacterium]|nr:hypothetical protein [Eggerthellaceae bacterium]